MRVKNRKDHQNGHQVNFENKKGKRFQILSKPFAQQTQIYVSTDPFPLTRGPKYSMTNQDLQEYLQLSYICHLLSNISKT